MASKHKKSIKSGKGNSVPEVSRKDAASLESDPDMFSGVHRSILEAFDNLNWDDCLSHEQQRSLSRHWIPPEEKTESHALKLINSELARFYTEEYAIPPLPEVETKLAFYLPGLKPSHQTILPKQSVLNFKEQRQLYNFYFRMTIKNKKFPLDGQELVAFQELRTKVSDEYAEFQEFAKSEWYKGHWNRVLQIPTQVERFIESLWQTRAGQCLAYYPDEYKIAKQIPLSLHDPHGDYCIFEFVKHVHTQSVPLKMGLPKMKNPVQLISEFEDLCQIKHITGKAQSSSKTIRKPVAAVSHDWIVDSLLKRNDVDADVVISMSGIKTLVDNVKFQREWVLPITVKDVIKEDGETVKRVVIIDKNLPPKSMSVHDKNLWHAKITAKWMLILGNNPNIFGKKEVLPFSKTKEGESYEELLNEAAEILNEVKSSGKVGLKSTKSGQGTASCKSEAKLPSKSSLETRNKEVRELITYNDLPAGEIPTDTVGLKHSLKTPGQRRNEKETLTSFNQWKSRKTKDEDLQEKNVTNRNCERQSLVSYDDPFTNFADQGPEEFGVAPSAPKIARVEGRKHKEIVFSEKSSKKSPEKTMKSNDKEAVSTRQQHKEGEVVTNDSEFTSSGHEINQKGSKRECMQYQIWNIHKSKYIQFLKAEQRSLNVLVRVRRDGVLFHYQDNVRKLEDVCVSSKLEFQPEYGASKMTASELIREYLDLYLRPNSKLARVRSIGYTKELMMTELKTLPEIKTALQVEVCQLQKLYDPLYAVLTKLVDLPPGCYMLQHTAKMGPFATLFQESPGWSGFNLPLYCQELKNADVNVPPMPIDPLVLSPLQHRDKFPPALFIPKVMPTGNQRNFFRKPNPAPIKKKRKKKRPKEKLKEKLKEKTVKSCNSVDEGDMSYDSVDSLDAGNL